MDEKNIISKYLGVPFKHGGRDLAGLDCWGLGIMLYKDLGFELMDVENYEKHWGLKGKDYFLENYYKDWEKVEIPFLFDGVLFNNYQGLALHCGFVLNNYRFIHCARNKGVVINSITDPNIKSRTEGYYHLKARNDYR